LRNRRRLPDADESGGKFGLKIRFIKDGGPNKNGAFIEYDGDAPTGDETEYERERFISINLICCKTEAVASFNVIKESEESAL